MSAWQDEHFENQIFTTEGNSSCLELHIFMQKKIISESLRAWYGEHRRDLPWRATADPYHIWVSEIILQQTRVDQGLPYYSRFIAAYPDIHTLASASVTSVLKVWQGLGYYTRARNMHETAKFIDSHLGGHFPDSYDGLLKLKGIGRYTAAAIASLAFNKPVPVLDANAYRVISRLSGIRFPVNHSRSYILFRDQAAKIMDRQHPAEHNQAIMELGALVCVPSCPQCLSCPVSGDCYAFAHGLTDQLPVREKKISLRKRYFYYFIITEGRYVYLNHRGKADIWKGLYDFPMEESARPVDPEKITGRETWRKLFSDDPVKVSLISSPIKHRLTHQLITAVFFHIVREGNAPIRQEGLIRTDKNKVMQYPLPKLVENYLGEAMKHGC